MSGTTESRNVSETMFLELARKHEALEEKCAGLEAALAAEAQARTSALISINEQIETVAQEIIEDLAIAETLEDIEEEKEETTEEPKHPVMEEIPPAADEPKKRIRAWA